MKKLAFVSLLVVAAISPFLSFGAECVYLKPLGASEERTTQDGESWATAYASPATAIAAAASAGKPVYAAQGVYVISTLIEMPASGVAIYGGFEGVRDDETVEGRDWDKYETIFSGDTQGNDVWVHVQPNLMQYVATTRTATTEPVIKDGRVNLPAYTGDYDTYETSHDYDCNRCFHFGSGVGGTVDGIWITSFQRSGHDGAGMLIESGGDISVRNCRFVGCCGALGTIKVTAATNAKIAIEDCKFINNSTYYRTAGIVAQAKDLQLKGCEFIGYTQQADSLSSSGLGIHLKSTGITLTNCTFARGYAFNATGGNEISTAGGLAVIVSSEQDGSTGVFRDCVFTNNLSISTVAAHNATAAGAPLFNARNCDFVGCHIANNRQEITVKAGYSYNMFRGSENKDTRQVIERCSFVSNTVYAVVAADSDAGQYAVGILGNHQSRSQHFALVNDTFMDNQIVAAETETVKALKSRGVLVTSTAAGIQPSFGLANCTFHGAAAKGVYDLAQFGSTQTKTMNVVNCLFESGADADYEPFSFAVPSVVKFYSTSVKNNLVPVEGVVTNDYQSDEVPFAPLTVAEGCVAGTLTPIAAPPGIRHSADFARNAATAAIGNSLFSFKPAGSASWMAFDPALSGGTASAGGLITDANGVERPAGSFTRGAVQSLGGAAEGGVTLTIRRDPIAAGSLNGPAVQSVAVGGTLTPVTVVPGAGKAVEGWYEEGSETPIPTDTPEKLPLATLSKDTILTVRFTVPQVKVTFDLGEHGHFNAAGNPSKAEVLSTPGKEFPAVPEFTIDEAWHMVSWDKSFPLLTPETDESFTAKYVTKDVRIVYATPEGAGKKDGTSWENAYAGVAAAYADAGLYRGEVWLKGGFYPIANVIQWKNNVTVRGGFAGTETDAEAADPEAHPTVLSGDLNGDDYWWLNGADPAAADRIRIWENGHFNAPTEDESICAWQPFGNYSDDLVSCFNQDAGEVVNSAFVGLTFTGFQTAAIRVAGATSSKVTVKRCRFLGVRGWRNVTGAAILLRGAALLMEKCEFVGTAGGVNVEENGLALEDSQIVDTLFSRMYSTSCAGGVYYKAGSSVISVDNCRFVRCDSDNGTTMSAAALTAANGTCRVNDCVFSNCTVRASALGAIVQDSGSLVMTRCQLVGGRMIDAQMSRQWASPCIGMGNGFLIVRDSLIANNVAGIPVGCTKADTTCGAAFCGYMGSATFLNCTFKDNACDSASPEATFRTGIFANNYTSLSLVNCVVSGGTLSGNQVAVFVDSYGNSSTKLSLVNSIVETEGTPTFYSGVSGIKFGAANSYAKGLDLAAFDAPSFAVNIGTKAPLVKSGLRYAKDGRVGQLALSGNSPYRAGGCKVWQESSGDVVFFDETEGVASPYCRVRDFNRWATRSDLDGAVPLVPDAFGRERKAKKIAFGPLNADPLGLVIILR